ncbi:putative nuclease of restriction endonuclease-like (RecB) superfamily [Flavobacterium arsenatis]|uniref:Nuclease of restriction endonuclease-like (RecB) superfamily n=1 Tax=Flavobacterium arsenatis TaxID=1484332 RepID=A0ABU1TT36_9FLAO|nr:PDDEXK nuclease domain-containing protein [Flavobacterium arsenatis]MDR6969034.1 putative nuclease of restriction endonuclease-like (RecB) superfamily [Flavobacterium arsenatis]
MKLENAHIETIKELKSAILSSRYRLAVLANSEMLGLYFTVGKLISTKVKEEKWGSKVLENLSADLQNELPGLRGFSASNIKKMRIFYESWSLYFTIGSSVTNQFQNTSNGLISISSLITNEFENDFNKVSFTHHFEILSKTNSIEHYVFYIQKIASEFWSVSTLQYHLKSNLFENQGSIANNFIKTISENDLRSKALLAFKDEYLLDFINIEDPEEENERFIENEIVRNIKKFLLSLGTDFAFIANQYRFILDENEYFVDLLFYNRRMQCLVAFDLKSGKFKPEYLGKMNFYLSALDEMVKLPHENSSIGVILCKEKNNKVVEFSFRDFNKSMGVSTYKTANELPDEYKGLLPNEKILKKLMD